MWATLGEVNVVYVLQYVTCIMNIIMNIIIERADVSNFIKYDITRYKINIRLTTDGWCRGMGNI